MWCLLVSHRHFLSVLLLCSASNTCNNTIGILCCFLSNKLINGSNDVYIIIYLFILSVVNSSKNEFKSFEFNNKTVAFKVPQEIFSTTMVL